MMHHRSSRFSKPLAFFALASLALILVAGNVAEAQNNDTQPKQGFLFSLAATSGLVGGFMGAVATSLILLKCDFKINRNLEDINLSINRLHTDLHDEIQRHFDAFDTQVNNFKDLIQESDKETKKNIATLDTCLRSEIKTCFDAFDTQVNDFKNLIQMFTKETTAYVDKLEINLRNNEQNLFDIQAGKFNGIIQESDKEIRQNIYNLSSQLEARLNTIDTNLNVKTKNYAQALASRFETNDARMQINIDELRNKIDAAGKATELLAKQLRNSTDELQSSIEDLKEQRPDNLS